MSETTLLRARSIGRAYLHSSLPLIQTARGIDLVLAGHHLFIDAAILINTAQTPSPIFLVMAGGRLAWDLFVIADRAIVLIGDWWGKAA